MAQWNFVKPAIAIAAVFSVVAIVAPSGCKPRDENGPITLHFWNGFTGPDGRTMLALVKKFNDTHPDIHVVMQRMEWGTYYNKLFVAGLGHRAPEVFVIHTDAIGRFVRANLLRSMDDLLTPAGIDPADIDPNVLDACESQGHHWTVPLDIHLIGMFYNRTLLKNAGIDHPPTNETEFIDDLTKLKQTDSTGRVTQWGFVFPWPRIDCFTILDQFGGEVFSPDHSMCTFDSPQCVAAMQWCADLVMKQKLAPTPENFDPWVGFLQGKVGITFHGIFMLADLQKQQDLDWAAAPLPQVGPQQAAWANSHNLCLRPDLSEREAEAGKQFIKFLSDNSLDWAAGGQVPIRKSLRNTPRFAGMVAQSEFAKEIPYAHYMPRVPFTTEYQEQFDLATERILRGSATPADALHEATVQIEKVIARYRLADEELKGTSQ
jgi:multiple sugar transport system substrate-binding protein